MTEIYENEKKAGMYLVVVDVENFPLTFDDEGRYKITLETYSQLVKVTDSKLFNKYLKDLCEKPGAKVSYYFICEIDDMLVL